MPPANTHIAPRRSGHSRGKSQSWYKCFVLARASHPWLLTVPIQYGSAVCGRGTCEILKSMKRHTEEYKIKRSTYVQRVRKRDWCEEGWTTFSFTAVDEILPDTQPDPNDMWKNREAPNKFINSQLWCSACCPVGNTDTCGEISQAFEVRERNCDPRIMIIRSQMSHRS